MEIKLQSKDAERILSALETERNKIKDEIEIVSKFDVGCDLLWTARNSYSEQLNKEFECLKKLILSIEEILDASEDEEEAE